MAAPVRSDSFSSSRGSELRLPLAIRHGRSRSFTIGTSSFPEPEPHHESHRESLSKGRYPGEPPRRSYYSFTLKNVVAGLLLVCFAAFLLVHDVRSAPLVLRMFQEDQSSDVYHNASDDSTPGEVLGDIDLSVEENAAVEEGFGGDSNSAVAEESAPEEAMIVDMDADVPIAGWDIPRAIPKTWKPPKRCATVEEMGWETTGDTRAASLRVRAMIQDWMAVHGAKRVSQLVASDFCQQGFVLGMPMEDGFGNNMYKVLTAAGVALMLNRSLIIAEHGALNWGYSRRDPGKKRAFEEYLEFSEEAFTMREVRRLWAVNKCKRALVIHNDSLEKGFRRTSCICDDWTALTAPILHFRGAIGSGAIQLLLKNKHLAMRRAAVQLLGHPGIPSSRPNTFGELFRAFIAPNADIRDAVQWALKGGPDPDITLHLRMLHSRTKPAPQAASSCITRIRRNHPTRGRPRVVVVTDTPAITRKLKKALGDSTEVVQFDYRAYAKQMTNRSEVLSLSYGVPKSRIDRKSVV